MVLARQTYLFYQIKSIGCINIAVDSGSWRSTGYQGLCAEILCIMLVDFEKLRMTGAGKAIAVLTSGGDAQGRN